MNEKNLMSTIHSLVCGSSSELHSAIMLLYEMPKSEECNLMIEKLSSISNDLSKIIQDPNLFTILGH